MKFNAFFAFLKSVSLYLCEKYPDMFEDFRLNVFLAVAQEGSFTKAASTLGVSQPAVSQNVADLEKMLGVKLFDRQRGEVVLTQQGEVFMKYARNIIDSCVKAESMFTDLSPRVIRVSASEEIYEYIIAPALESFLKVHTDLVIERVMFGDADLTLALAKAPESPFEPNPDAVLRLRLSVSPAMKMGDFTATHEKISYFDLLFKPSATFACTKACRLLKNYLASLL